MAPPRYHDENQEPEAPKAQRTARDATNLFSSNRDGHTRRGHTGIHRLMSMCTFPRSGRLITLGLQRLHSKKITDCKVIRLQPDAFERVCYVMRLQSCDMQSCKQVLSQSLS